MSSGIETPVPHSDLASTILAQLRAVVQSINGFGFVTAEQRRRLSSSASVPDQFLLTVALALDESADLASAAKVQGIELRDAVNYTNAFRTVATELEIVARGLRETIETRRAHAGSRALRAYKVAQSYNRPSDRDLVIPHLKDMKRTLGRGRPRQTTASAATRRAVRAVPAVPAVPEQ